MTLFMRCCVFLALAAFTGCQSAAVKKNTSPANSKETLSAVGKVADALTGQSLTDDQKKKLTNDIQKDKQVQSALKSISDSMDLKKAEVKYCPVDGQRFSVNQTICPIHHVPLKTLAD